MTALLLQQTGRIYCAAFTDDVLFSELAQKAVFWQQRNFFGVDLSALHSPAVEGYFSQVLSVQAHQLMLITAVTCRIASANIPWVC